MMPAKAEHEGRRSQHIADNVFQAGAYAQPWWREMATNTAIGERTSKSSFVEHPNGSLANGATQSQPNVRLDNGANFHKEMPATIASQSGIYL